SARLFHRASATIYRVLGFPFPCLALFAHDNLIAPDIHRVFFQGLWRRPCDIFAVQIEMAIMTGTPYFAEIRAILDDAAKMSAGRRNGPYLSRRCINQNRWLAAKAKNLPAVRLELLWFEGQCNCPGRGLFRLGRNQVAADGIKHREGKRPGGGAKEP